MSVDRKYRIRYQLESKLSQNDVIVSEQIVLSHKRYEKEIRRKKEFRKNEKKKRTHLQFSESSCI